MTPTEIKERLDAVTLGVDVNPEDYSDFVTHAPADIRFLLSELAAAQKQFPEGMEHCTFVFKECDKGHGRLTATNWIDHGCDTCRIGYLTQAVAAAQADNARLREALHPYATKRYEGKLHWSDAREAAIAEKRKHKQPEVLTLAEELAIASYTPKGTHQ